MSHGCAADTDARSPGIKTQCNSDDNIYHLSDVEFDAEAEAEAIEKFFTHLAQNSDVEAALSHSGLQAGTALWARARDEQFTKRWRQALAAGFDELEMTLLHRARFGTEKPIYYGGERIDTVREYDNALGFKILTRHKDEAAKARQRDQALEAAIPAEDELRKRVQQICRKVAVKNEGSDTQCCAAREDDTKAEKGD